MGQLGLERVAHVGRSEVALAVAPQAHRIDDAADQLADRTLALRTAERAAEIFRHDDVGGGLRPEARHFDVALLEHDAAVFAGNHGAAQLPLDFAHRVDAGPGKEALER